MPIKLRSEIVQFLPDVLMPREDESDGPHCRVMNSALIILWTGLIPSCLPGDQQQRGQCGSNCMAERREEEAELLSNNPGSRKTPTKGSIIILCKIHSSGGHN